MKVQRIESIIVKKEKELISMLEQSTAIYNQALFHMRQEYFKTRDEGKIKTFSYNQLYKIMKEVEIFKNSNLDFVVKQAVIKQVISNWTSFIRAIISFNKNPNLFKARPKLPKYLKNGKLNLITIDSTRLRKKNCKENEIRLPKTEYKFKTRIKRENINCIRVLNFYDKIKIEIIYKRQLVHYDINKGNCVGIDIGLNNLATVTSNNQSLSWIINGRPVKSMNQYFNKEKAKLQGKLLKEQKTSKRIEKLCKKRKLKLEHYLHWASKEIVYTCLGNNIGTIIIGKNRNWKQEINLGKRNNQNFVQIPFARFIEMIKYKAEEVGIQVFCHEEAYTSKVDHLALESLGKQENYLGKRIKRGLFKSSTGKILNADCNGAIGIMRKQKVITDDQLMILRDRGDIVSPLIINHYDYKLKR